MKTATSVEKQVIRSSDPYFSMLDEFCFRAKNLYNHANYLVKTELTTNDKWLRYQDLDRILKHDKEFPDYRRMPGAVSAQQVLRSVDSIWKSYFEAHKDWKEHPEKYLGEPKFPKYKDKTKGRFPIQLTNQVCLLLPSGKIKFPRIFNGFNTLFKAASSEDFVKFNQCRILPRGNHIVLEMVYESKIAEKQQDNHRYLGIDLGVDNLAAVSNNVGAPFYLIDGKGLKSINRYWNKLVSDAQSNLQRGGVKRYKSIRTEKLNFKRNQKVNDYLHKASRWIVDFAAKENINTIVIGKNKLWKQNSTLGRSTNQKFVQLPHARFVDMIAYKAKKLGIKVVCVEESYTSKTSFLDNEDPCKHDNYKGKRTHRGLFKTANGCKINADSNGALQIIKKFTMYDTPNLSQTQILLQNPIRINVS